MKNKPNKMKTFNILRGLLMIAVFLITSMGNAALRTINCSTVAQIKAAMADARPGDEIIIAAGTYASDAKVKDGFGKFNYFSGLADGTAANPIIIRGASSTNLPILTVPTNLRYVSPIMGITGDYWVIKDLEISYGQKGLMLDTANNCKIINVTIHHTDQEGLHLRSNSSNNLVQNCKIYETGIGDGGTGEGVYIGSDQKSHSTYSPSCDNNVIDNCNFGPNVRAEGIDIKEGTQYTIVKNCTFSASGISNLNSADAFIDAKGGYTFIHNNTFNADNEPNLASCIDFQQRTGTNSGYRIAIFNNTFNLGTAKSGIPTARKKGGTPSQVHIWSNTRNPSSPDFPISDGTLNFVTQSCPSWNILPCSGGGTGSGTNTPPTASITSPSNGATFSAGANITINATATDNGSVTKVDFYRGNTLLGTDTTGPSYQYTISNASAGSYALKVVATDNNGATTTSSIVNITVNSVVVNPPTGGGCNFGTPTSAGLGSFDRITFNKMYKLGSGGPDASNFKNFKINWNLSSNSLVQFAYSTKNGVPSYYNDLKPFITQNFSSSSPSVKITNSGISGLDGDYWVTKKGLNLILVTKNGSHTLYFTNETTAPSCSASREVSEINNSPFEFANIYPNPSNGVLNIDGISTESNLLISDLQGKTVLQKTNIKNEKNIDISNLTDGLYIVTFEGNGTSKNLKLIISR